MGQIILPYKMDYDLIDVTPIRFGWGRIWQGGSPTEELYGIPEPLVIVNLNRGEINENFINSKNILGVVSIWMDDLIGSELPDRVLVAAVESAISYLKQGISLYVHCRCGVSRSTYFIIALYMRLGLSFQEAWMRVKIARSCAQPNHGFIMHLKSLEKKLNDLSIAENKNLLL